MIDTPTAAERLLRRSGIEFSRGSWTRAMAANEDEARKLRTSLEDLFYQVRHIAPAKGGKWEVVFR